MNSTLRDVLTHAALVVALCSPMAAVTWAPETANGAAREPVVSAHRGATGVPGVPENTPEAFAYAAAGGAKVLETDVRWTRDLRMVTLHDATLDRTTRCTGPVERITYQQLRRCATPAEVPTFAASLRAARAHGMQINPEPKAPAGGLTDHQLHEYVERIAYYGMTRRTVVSSFNAALLPRVARQPQAAGLRYSLITDSRGAVSPQQARRAGKVYMPVYWTLTRASVAAYQAAGVQVWAWPARKAEDVRAMRALGVNVIVADDPAAAKRWLAAAR